MKPAFILKYIVLAALPLILYACGNNSPVPNQKPLKDTMSYPPGDTPANVKELIIFNRADKSKLKSLPATITQFIPAGYEALDTSMTDLNRDGLTDILLVANKKGEEENKTDTVKRWLLLLLKQKVNTFKLVCKNKNAIPCGNCGGMMGDAYAGIIADSATFTIQFYGGSNWKGTGAYTFAWSKSANDWFLIRQITEFYFMDKRQYTSDTLTGVKLGKVSICKFSIY